MLGHQPRAQPTLFIPGSIDALIPDDHILKRVDRILDLSWLRTVVAEEYSATQGRPSIDPEAAVRLMLAGFFQGIVHDRKLLRDAQVNLAIRWFAGYRLDEALPDHSSLTRIRQRWGPERFKQIFQRTVAHCLRAGLVTGETVHLDATLIRADVSWASLTTAHAERVLAENDGLERPEPPRPGRPRRARPPKKRSTTDPDATLATSRKDQRLEPSYKQHTAVDDTAGIVVDVAVTTGEVNEGTQLVAGLARIEATTGVPVRTVTADGAYAHPANYAALETRGMAAVIPPAAERQRARRLPLRRFAYDARHDVVRCPQGKHLSRAWRGPSGWFYRARRQDCRACPLRARCIPPSMAARVVCIVDHHDALLRARRHRLRWDATWQTCYRRHRWQVEGVHGEAKSWHGLRRAVRRGLANVAIQVYLTAAVLNLKRLAVVPSRLWRVFVNHVIRSIVQTASPTFVGHPVSI